MPKIDSDENTAAHSERERRKKEWETWLAGLYLLFTGIGASLENTLETAIQQRIVEGKATLQERYFFEYFLSHIGDVTDGFIIASIGLIVGETVFALLDNEEKNELMQQVRKYVSLIVVTIAALIVVDAETVQVLKNFFPDRLIGEPFITDIPAGLFGILTATLVIEKSKKEKVQNSQRYILRKGRLHE